MGLCPVRVKPYLVLVLVRVTNYWITGLTLLNLNQIQARMYYPFTTLYENSCDAANLSKRTRVPLDSKQIKSRPN